MNIRLSELNIDELAKIVGFNVQLSQHEKRRLLDLGFVLGALINIKFKDVSNNLIAVNIKNSTFALRKSQSENIFVEKIEI